MKQQAVAQLLAAERVSVLERLAGLERELAAIIESSGSAGTDDEHDPEGATVAFERQHLAALVSQARGHLTQIDAAMIRLADGSYGICERCGVSISEARLAARPVTTLCITCAARRLPGADPEPGPAAEAPVTARACGSEHAGGPPSGSRSAWSRRLRHGSHMSAAYPRASPASGSPGKVPSPARS